MFFERPFLTKRFVIAVILAIGVMVLRFFDKISIGEFSTIITAIIGFYFRDRVDIESFVKSDDLNKNIHK